ncbi:MAG: hypothetical protein JXA39_06770 [Bacteroidales bacterium]|nr:hypothetical protein [Bacteroidales bacterium]
MFPFSLSGNRRYLRVPSYSYWPVQPAESLGKLLMNPGFQALLREAMPFHRPFAMPCGHHFRDLLRKTPSTSRSYDLNADRVKSLLEPSQIRFGFLPFGSTLQRPAKQTFFAEWFR